VGPTFSEDDVTPKAQIPGGKAAFIYPAKNAGARMRLPYQSLRAREKLTTRVELLFYLRKTESRRDRAWSA
jgi:hypothetical protein